MNCFEFDLNHTIKVSLFGLEHLVPPRVHITRCTDICILYFVVEGELRLSVNGREICLRQGDIYIFDRGDIQKPLEATDTKYYYVHFEHTGQCTEMNQSQYFERVRQKDVDFAKANNHGTKGYDYLKVYILQTIHIWDRDILDYLLSRFETCCSSFWGKSQENRYHISVCFAEILQKLENVCVNLSETGQLRSNQLTYDTVRVISDYISKNFSADIGRKQIEKTFLVNYDYTNRNFKQIMGQSIVRYRNMLRIDHARLLLSTTEKSVTDIAEETGFGDKYYFSRYFKKIVGVSPLDYKRKAQPNDL